MGKRPSDFMALAAIVSGAGLGLGLTNLYAHGRADREPYSDDASVNIRVPRHRIVVEPRRIDDSCADAQVVRHAVIVQPRRITDVHAPEAMAPRLERLRTQVRELRLQAREMGDVEGLLEALEGVEALEDVDMERDLTIDILRGDEDQRRRRRRRRPHRAAEVPDSDPSRN